MLITAAIRRSSSAFKAILFSPSVRIVEDKLQNDMEGRKWLPYHCCSRMDYRVVGLIRAVQEIIALPCKSTVASRMTGTAAPAVYSKSRRSGLLCATR